MCVHLPLVFIDDDRFVWPGRTKAEPTFLPWDCLSSDGPGHTVNELVDEYRQLAGASPSSYEEARKAVGVRFLLYLVLTSFDSRPYYETVSNVSFLVI